MVGILLIYYYKNGNLYFKIYKTIKIMYILFDKPIKYTV